MPIALLWENNYTEIGTPDLLHSFFSTVSANLEPAGWGTRFPHIMNELYSGRVAGSDAGAALEELRTIRTELAELPSHRLVWDIETPAKQPPPDRRSNIHTLDQYFVSPYGRNILELLDELLSISSDKGGDLAIVSLDRH